MRTCVEYERCVAVAMASTSRLERRHVRLGTPSLGYTFIYLVHLPKTLCHRTDKWRPTQRYPSGVEKATSSPRSQSKACEHNTMIGCAEAGSMFGREGNTPKKAKHIYVSLFDQNSGEGEGREHSCSLWTGAAVSTEIDRPRW